MSKKYIFFDDILIGIFSYFKKGKNQFIHDGEDFHTFFYEQRENYPVLLGDKAFRTRMFPRSQELDQAYNNLMHSGLLYSWGIDFNPHEFSPKCRKYFNERIKPELTEKEIEGILKLSEEFQKRFMK
ncbi:MAG TPA: hypothetical protein VJB11_03710 [archaeon]|nr:hypothetical protein [archaeon]